MFCLFPASSGLLSRRAVELLPKAFYASNEMITRSLSLFVCMVDYFYQFMYIELYLHLWDEGELFMLNEFLVCSWNQVASILLSIFASMFLSDIGL